MLETTASSLEYLPALVKWVTPAPPPCKMCAKLAALPADCASLGDAGLQAAAAAARAAAGVLWEDSFWLVMHKRPPCGVVGHLQLISKRHFQGPSTFSNAEATIFGVTLRRCERALEQATGCDRVYTAALGSPKSGGHFHAHMMPVFDDKPPKEVTGTPFDIFLQEKLAADGVEGAAADEAECARVAEAWRFAMHDPRGPPKSLQISFIGRWFRTYTKSFNTKFSTHLGWPLPPLAVYNTCHGTTPSPTVYTSSSSSMLSLEARELAALRGPTGVGEPPRPPRGGAGGRAARIHRRYSIRDRRHGLQPAPAMGKSLVAEEEDASLRCYSKITERNREMRPASAPFSAPPTPRRTLRCQRLDDRTS